MPQFDPELWKTRAIRRFQKSNNDGRRNAGSKLHKDIASIQHIAAVVQWCETRKLSVFFTRRFAGIYEPSNMSIKVCGRLEPEQQLYVLLHECGHHLVGDRKPGERYGKGWNASDGATKRTLVHRIDVIDEELEAWHRGLKLAKRLKIKVNLERYNAIRAKYVKTYLRWATERTRSNHD